MEVFGSPTAVERAPPLILFVVDLAKASERISLESHLSAIELAIVRTLLFQFLHVDNRLSWTYQLFDSRIGTVNSISPQKYPSEFSFESLNDFHTALTKYARDFGPEKTLDIPLLSNVSRSLERAMQDMKWDWNDHIARVAGALLSPPQLVKNPTLSGAQRSFKIRNQLILISHAFPNTTEDLLSFVHGNQSPKMTAESDTNSFAECVKEIQGTFFGHSNRMSRLWTLLIEKRASLSILGFGKTEINQPDEVYHSGFHKMISHKYRQTPFNRPYIP